MDIIAQLRRDEGVKKFPYTDTVGKLTIGVGRNLTDVGLADTEINFLLRNDIYKVQQELTARFPFFAALDLVRQNVLVNMGFNLGVPGLAHFHLMMAAIEKNDWTTAASEMLNSQWARQVGNRATRLALQMTSGEWQ